MSEKKKMSRTFGNGTKQNTFRYASHGGTQEEEDNILKQKELKMNNNKINTIFLLINT